MIHGTLLTVYTFFYSNFGNEKGPTTARSFSLAGICTVFARFMHVWNTICNYGIMNFQLLLVSYTYLCIQILRPSFLREVVCRRPCSFWILVVIRIKVCGNRVYVKYYCSRVAGRGAAQLLPMQQHSFPIALLSFRLRRSALVAASVFHGFS